MIGTLFGIGSQHPEPGILVNGRILKQSQGFIGNTATRDNFHIYLDSFPGIRHLFVRLWFILRFLYLFHQTLAFEYTVQGFDPSRITAFPQAAPKFNHAESRISPFHIANQFQLFRRMFIGVFVGPPGLEHRDFSVPSHLFSQKYMNERARLYFLLAFPTPYFFAYCNNDCLYLVSCVIVSMQSECSFLSLVSQLYYNGFALALHSFLSALYNMYCNPTRTENKTAAKFIDTRGVNE